MRSIHVSHAFNAIIFVCSESRVVARNNNNRKTRTCNKNRKLAWIDATRPNEKEEINCKTNRFYRVENSNLLFLDFPVRSIRVKSMSLTFNRATIMLWPGQAIDETIYERNIAHPSLAAACHNFFFFFFFFGSFELHLFDDE